MKKNRTATAIRFDPDVHEKLIQYSDTLDVSVNWLVNRAVKQWLADLPPAETVELRLTNKQ